MSILDATLARTPGAADSVLGLAKELGLDAAKAEKAIMILTQCHVRKGDTIAVASAQTGLDAGALSGIVAQIGGDEGLDQLVSYLSMDGNKLGQGSFLDGIFG